MKNWKCIVVLAALVAFAVPAMAQTPAIGVFFDMDATQTTATQNGGWDVQHVAYVMATNAEQMVGGGAYKLELDPRIMLIDAVYPAGIQNGSPTGTGVEVALTDAVVAYYGVPALLSTVTFTTMDNIMSNAPIAIGAMDRYTAPVISDHLGALSEVDGMTSYLTIPVPNDAQTWGSMKALYAE